MPIDNSIPSRFNQQTNRAAHEKTIHMGIKRDKSKKAKLVKLEQVYTMS